MRLICALVAASVFVAIGSSPAEDEANRKGAAAQPVADADSLIVTRVYKFADLPVWTKEKACNPVLLMHLLQSTVLPEQWEGKGGRATMAFYPQNLSLIISATPKMHDEIVDLIELVRRHARNGSD